MPGSRDLSQKIECHMTFYLESKNHASRSQTGDEKIEGHVTLYLESNQQAFRA